MEEMTFEIALKKLEQITRELENGDIDLDKSIEKYKEATSLIEFASKKLKEAEETVVKIVNEDGSVSEFEQE